MNTPEPWKVCLLIGGLAIIAGMVNSSFPTRKQVHTAPALQSLQVSQSATQLRPAEPDAAAIARKRIQDAEAERIQYLARYVIAGVARKAGIEAVALLAVAEDGNLDWTVADTLSKRFSNPAVNLLSSFFKRQFISDGLFAKVWAGSPDIVAKLELSKSLDALLLAQREVQYSTNRTLENVITASMRLMVVRVPTFHKVRANKPTEFGDAEKRLNRNDTIANKGVCHQGTPPRSGEGCGDTLPRRIPTGERGKRHRVLHEGRVLKWVRARL